MKQPDDAARFIGINGCSRIAASNGAVTGAAMGTQRWVLGWAATGAANHSQQPKAAATDAVCNAGLTSLTALADTLAR